MKNRVGAFVFKSLTEDEVTDVISSLPRVIQQGDDLRTLLAVILHRYDISEEERLLVLDDVKMLIIMAAADEAVVPTHTGSERIN